MAESRQCEQTGLSTPECCCRCCYEVQLRRYAPELLPSAAPQRVATTANPGPRNGPIWLASDYAAEFGISSAQLHERARAEKGVGA